MKRFRWVSGAVLAGAVFMLNGHATGEILPANQEKITAVDQALHKVAASYRSKKYDEVAEFIGQIEASIEELKTNEQGAELAPVVASLELRLAAAQRLMRTSADMAAAEAEKKATMAKKTPPRPSPATARANVKPGGISFVKQVAPIFISRCSRCHIDKSSGGFSLASYADLRRGSSSGTVFGPGTGPGSTLVESMASGDMPRGGGGMPQAEIALISKWIDEGAIFDGGADPAAPIMQLVNGAPAQASTAPGPNTMAAATPATGGGNVQFMRDIAPILVGRCVGCHSGQQGAGNYEMDTFDKLKRPARANSGTPIVAGNPQSSLIVQMLHGTAKDAMGKNRPKMPRNGSLTDEEIKKIESWIASGARFDGDDPAELLSFLLAQLRALALPHEELAAERAALALKDWNKGNPGVAVDKVELDDVIVYGNVPPVRLQELAEQVSAVRKKLNTTLKLTGDTPLVKGKMTLFIFDKRFEYTEFSRMVEERDVTSDLSGHFFYNIIDAFGAIVAPKEGDPNFQILVAEQLLGAHIAAAGKKVPVWFAVGAARTLATKFDPKAGAQIKAWDEQAAYAMANAKVDFLTTKVPDSQQMSLAYAMVRAMVSNQTKFSALLDALHKGANFDQALQQTYGMTTQSLVNAGKRAGG